MTSCCSCIDHPKSNKLSSTFSKISKIIIFTEFFSLFCRWCSRTMLNVHTPYIQMGFPIPSRQRVCLMRMTLSTGIHMTMRFNPMLPLHMYGRSILMLGPWITSRDVEPGRTIQVLILWVLSVKSKSNMRGIIFFIDRININ